MQNATYDFAGTVVLVTGAGSGIGRAIAQAFLRHGASVLLGGRRPDPLEQTASGYPSEQFGIVAVDLATPAGVEALIHEAQTRWGRIDVVVANAGLSEAGTIATLDDSSWQRMRTINLDGLIHLARAALPALKQTQGNLIAISSIAGLGGDWNQTGYNATKGAVNALVQSMALDLGRDGVRVNAIAPGFIATDQTSARLDDPLFWAALRDRLALERAGAPDDIARVALFLASRDAAYITGVVLPVDGGITASVGTPRPVART